MIHYLESLLLTRISVFFQLKIIKPTQNIITFQGKFNTILPAVEFYDKSK